METKEKLEFGREYLVEGGYNSMFKYAGVEKSATGKLSHHFVRANYESGFICSMHIPVDDLRIDEYQKVTDCNRWYRSTFHYPNMIEFMGDEEEFSRLSKILIGDVNLN